MNEKLVEEIMKKRENLGSDFVKRSDIVEMLKGVIKTFDFSGMKIMRPFLIEAIAMMSLAIEQYDASESAPKIVWISPVDINNMGR